jgi:hypothetical protein
VFRGARWWAAPLVVAAVVCAFGPAASARTATKPALTVLQPCTYLTPSQVQKAFKAGPVTFTTGTGGPVSTTICNYHVGSVGTLSVFLLYPFFPPPGQTAVDVVEGQRADDTVTGLTLETVKVGTSAYADLDRAIVYVAASKKFAFELQWLPPGVSPTDGTPLTPKLQKQLVALAKTIVARSK